MLYAYKNTLLPIFLGVSKQQNFLQYQRTRVRSAASARCFTGILPSVIGGEGGKERK